MQKNLKTNANNLSENGVKSAKTEIPSEGLDVRVRQMKFEKWHDAPKYEFQILKDGKIVEESKHYGSLGVAMLAAETWLFLNEGIKTP